MARVFRLACYECENYSSYEESFGCTKSHDLGFKKSYISRVACKDFISKIHGSQGVLL